MCARTGSLLRSTSRLLFFVMALTAAHNAVAAEPLWSKLLFLKGPEADPNGTYPLNEQNGPWLIMAATFEGEGAEQQAHDLVYELRSRHKLEAYIHRMKFDFSQDLPQRHVARFDAPLKRRYRRPDSEQFAVLVGNFPNVTDKKAQNTLQKIKTAHTDTLEPSSDRFTYQQLANWRTFTRMQKDRRSTGGRDAIERGHMAKAFLVPNPLLPDDYFDRAGLDPLVLEMNQRVEHSLLDCPGKYTVQVATFRGRSIIQQSTIKAIEEGEKRLKFGLAEAAEKAHRMTLLLRAKGWEAYEFHDLKASIVTVGSFNAVGTRSADGGIVFDPQILKIINTFGSDKTASGGQILMPKDIKDIPFDMQPIPVEVPRRSISRDYESDRLSLLR
jgi:hypothetical protein